MSAVVLPIAAARGAPPCEVTIAFIADQGLGPNAEAVLRLIAAERSAAVIHSGDFDYEDDPAAWDAQLDAILGKDFPYFAVIGNHDKDEFYTSGGYQARLADRMERAGLEWEGQLGVRCTIDFQGVYIVMTAPGIFTTGDPQHIEEDYLRDRLASDHSVWRIASWHKDMRPMQLGDKSDETGWGVYEAARRGGAIIATGHEHSYSRTNLLASFATQTVASTDDILQLARDNVATPGDEGRTFAFVSGLGGRSIRAQHRCLPEVPPYGCGNLWASISTSSQGAKFGALFATFNYGCDPRLAHFYFKDVAGVVVDEFFVRAADPSLACRSDINGDHRVDAVDLLGMLMTWGQHGGPADLDRNGVVDTVDMLMMLNDFGQCG